MDEKLLLMVARNTNLQAALDRATADARNLRSELADIKVKYEQEKNRPCRHCPDFINLSKLINAFAHRHLCSLCPESPPQHWYTFCQGWQD
jgi:hypothetical protein